MVELSGGQSGIVGAGAGAYSAGVSVRLSASQSVTFQCFQLCLPVGVNRSVKSASLRWSALRKVWVLG